MGVEGWGTYRLAELGELNRGKSKHRPRDAKHLYGGPYPFLQTGDIKAADGLVTTHTQTYSEAGLAQSRLWPKGTVAITIAANIAETAILGFDACFPDSVVGFIADHEKTSGRFVEYLFRRLKRQIQHEHVGSGSVQDNINLGILNQLEFDVPPLPEQAQILRVIGSLDDKIEMNRRMNETLEEMARALFRDWFVDFGPTRRQMEGATDPAAIMGHAFSPEKATTLASLFPAKLGDCGLPEGWNFGTVADHIDFNPKEPLRKGTIAPYSDMASLPTSGSLIAPPVARDFKSGMRFRNGDALIARITPCLENGKAGFVDHLTEEAPVGWGSTEFFVLRSKPHVAPQFAYCLVRDPDFKKRAEQSMTGTSGRQRAQIEVLMSYQLAVPDDSVHAEFGAITTPFFYKIKANGEENQTLAEMRDLLLPKLMSGEIRLKNAEAVS